MLTFSPAPQRTATNLATFKAEFRSNTEALQADLSRRAEDSHAFLASSRADFAANQAVNVAAYNKIIAASDALMAAYKKRISV